MELVIDNYDSNGLAPPKKQNGKNGVKIKDQVRMVVNEMDHVLTELKSVAGDIRVLVDQIDKVTNKIDAAYGADGKPRDRRLEGKQNKVKRRRSANVEGELQPQKRNNGRMRHSTSDTFEFLQSDFPWTFCMQEEIPSSDEEMAKAARKLLLLKQLDYTSKEIDMMDPPNYTKPQYPEDKSSRSPSACTCLEKVSPQSVESNLARSCDIPMRSGENSRRSRESDMNKQEHRRSYTKDSSTTSDFLEELHKKCEQYTPSPMSDSSYSGVYEKELDEQLENNFDTLDSYDTFDSSEDLPLCDTGILPPSNDFEANYDRAVNTWTTYAMVQIDGAGIEYEFSDDQTLETDSDILNDNRISSPTTFDSRTNSEFALDNKMSFQEQLVQVM